MYIAYLNEEEGGVNGWGQSQFEANGRQYQEHAPHQGSEQSYHTLPHFVTTVVTCLHEKTVIIDWLAHVITIKGYRTVQWRTQKMEKDGSDSD